MRQLRLHWDAGTPADCPDCGRLVPWDGVSWSCAACGAAFAPDGATPEQLAQLKPARWVADVPIVIPQYLIDGWARTQGHKLQLDRLRSEKSASKREELKRAIALLLVPGAVEQRVAVSAGASILAFESTQRLQEDRAYIDMGAASPRPNLGMLAHLAKET